MPVNCKEHNTDYRTNVKIIITYCLDREVIRYYKGTKIINKVIQYKFPF